MKTKLLKKWRKQCECTTIEPLVYCGGRGDRFFSKYAKYSRHWPVIKVECELNGLSPDNIYDTNHPLHSRFAPSKRLHFTAQRRCYHKPFFDFDFSSLYQMAINACRSYPHKKSFEIGSEALNRIQTLSDNLKQFKCRCVDSDEVYEIKFI